MNSFKRFLFVSITLFGISSCSTSLDDYKPKDSSVENSKAHFFNKPFDIKEYFDGNVIAWGMIEDYSNKVSRRFCVEIQGTWKNNEGVLAEKFYFDDGEISYRNWALTKQTDGSYQGQAEDVVGIAIGKHQGFAFQFTYQLSLVVDEETYQVSMDDWMYQLDEYRVMNKTSMNKFGVNVAEVTLFFDKQTPNQSCPVINK